MPRPTSRFFQSVQTFYPFALGVSFAGAAAASLTDLSITHWYLRLAKPTWAAPANLFGPVTTVLYASIAVAAWLVYKKAGWEGARSALILWGIQLVLNAFWPGFFFALRNPKLGAVEGAVLLGFVIATAAAFWRHDRRAGMMMLPYTLWEAYVTALTSMIWRMNR